MTTREQVLDVFRESGGTDMGYLEAHLNRFLNTYQRFDASWDRNRGMRMLDIGAHWLHQAFVFRLGGYQVMAADVPVTFEIESVKSLAEKFEIDLVPYQDLSAQGSLSAVESNSINIIMMAEIIEHITFNPIELWKEVYRVLAPGGRIIVTTPNYYRRGGHAWQFKRFLQGFGHGITTLEILNVNTMGHHWKEFSLRELQHYFCSLSPDFNCVRGDYIVDKKEENGAFHNRVKWLRQGLHIEVDLIEKKNGITVVPSW